jgi:hypothetical protein
MKKSKMIFARASKSYSAKPPSRLNPSETSACSVHRLVMNGMSLMTKAIEITPINKGKHIEDCSQTATCKPLILNTRSRTRVPIKEFDWMDKRGPISSDLCAFAYIDNHPPIASGQCIS